MTDPDSTYAKPFLTVPEQIRRLRERGMDCGSDAYASSALERYGYYRLSGYWHLFRERPMPPSPQFDADGREIRIDSFVGGASLSHVVSLYDFDQELRSRLSDVLSTIEISFRFFMGHRLGRIDGFAHRNPETLGAVRVVTPHVLVRAVNAITRRSSASRNTPTKPYRDWLHEYDRHEKRARDNFVLHFRAKYGPHLPIWVATEVMSFGVLSNLFDLMRQSDQEILAARFQIYAADGRGDRAALANWLNNLRNVRNICAHYGRLWNRAFDVLIDSPGQSSKDSESPLFPLSDNAINNKLYGVLLVMQHLILSIAPGRGDVIDIAESVEARSHAIGFTMSQLGFPADWRSNPIWGRGFALENTPMLAASLLDRIDTLTAPQARAELTGAELKPSERSRTPEQMAGAKRGAQKALLRTYRHYKVVIEIELGATKYYPAFQFRGGKIINVLAEVNQILVGRCTGAQPVQISAALINWWQTPRSDLPPASDGSERSPLDLLNVMSEAEFSAQIEASDAVRGFVAPFSSKR